MVVCCDDTLLFSTNLSMELFEFCKATQMTEPADIKKWLCKNFDAMFLDDPSFKVKLVAEIEGKY